MSITDQILNEREQTHGLYREVASYSQTFKQLMRTSRNWERLDPVQAQTLELEADKIARILCGDPSHLDHWRDGAGYFELVVRDLEQAQAAHRAQTANLDRPDDEPAQLTEPHP